MIEPLTPEAEWETFLSTLPTWRPTVKRMLILSPHPDDETLGCGGLIAAQVAKGVEVVVVAVTDGEAAYLDAAGQVEAGLAETRRMEQTCALARLGVPASALHRFALPDSAVAAHERILEERLVPLLMEETLIVSPWRSDYHPDHEACGRAAEGAARRAGATLVSYFFWTWHRGSPDVLGGLALRRFPLDKGLLLAKDEALRCHASQLEHASGGPILPENLLGPARRMYEVFLVP